MEYFINQVEQILTDVYKRVEMRKKKRDKRFRELFLQLKADLSVLYTENNTGNKWDLNKLNKTPSISEQMQLNALRSTIQELLARTDVEEFFKQQLRMLLSVQPLSSYELFMLSIEAKLTVLQTEEYVETNQAWQDAHQEAYYKQSYMYDMALVGAAGALLLSSESKAVVDAPSFDMTAKERMVMVKNDTMRRVRTGFTSSVNAGKGLRETAEELFEKVNSLNSSNKTLDNTETARVLGDANIKAMKKAGIKRYQFLATLDTRTSKICQSLDNKVFDIKDRKVGVNSSPMHPNCRSTEVAFLDDIELDNRLRISRDKFNKNQKVKASVSYDKWLEEVSK